MVEVITIINVQTNNAVFFANDFNILISPFENRRILVFVIISFFLDYIIHVFEQFVNICFLRLNVLFKF